MTELIHVKCKCRVWCMHKKVKKMSTRCLPKLTVYLLYIVQALL